MNTVLITTSSFRDDLLEKLRGMNFNPILNPLRRRLTEKEVTGLLREHKPIGMIAGVEPLTRDVLSGAEGLRTISRCGIGLDSVDLNAAKELGITVTNTPDAPTVPVAELTIGLILALLRGIPNSDAGIRRSEWVRPMGNLLQGKTVGIIGCGRIGTAVSKILSVFGCRLLGYDPVVTSSDLVEMFFFDSLLAASDIVTLHLPYTENTHHILDAVRLQSMKKGAILINASRGGLIDDQALLESLQSGHLAGAALDCFEQEPYTGPLTKLENVVLTGHIGSYAKEGRAIMEEQAVKNLLREFGKIRTEKSGEAI